MVLIYNNNLFNLHPCTLHRLISGSESRPSEGSVQQTVPLKKCHPLCSCDACERNTLNLRWKDITVHTPFSDSGF